MVVPEQVLQVKPGNAWIPKAAEDCRTPRRFARFRCVGRCASFWSAAVLCRFSQSLTVIGSTKTVLAAPRAVAALPERERSKKYALALQMHSLMNWRADRLHPECHIHAVLGGDYRPISVVET